LLGLLANGAVHTAVTVTGFRMDEAIQDNIITGEDNWQDSWEGFISDSQE
jgi:hypothetical protein